MAHCKHFQLPIADPGPCATCEREEMGSKGPLASFAGGRDNWRDGPTLGEAMRENVREWKERGIDAAPVDRNRWV